MPRESEKKLGATTLAHSVKVFRGVTNTSNSKMKPKSQNGLLHNLLMTALQNQGRMWL